MTDIIPTFENKFMSPEDLKEQLEMNHCYLWEDRRSLTTIECLVRYFPKISLTPLGGVQKKELQKAKDIIRKSIKLCEADANCQVGRFWKPHEWRICQVDEHALKWKIVKFIWKIMRGWQKKEDDHRNKYSITITEEDLIAFEAELKEQEKARA